MDFAFLEQAVNDPRAILYVRDAEGRYVWVNDAYDTGLPMGRVQVIGKTNRDLYGEQAANWEIADRFVAATSDFIVTVEELHDTRRKKWRRFVSTKLCAQFQGKPYMLGISIEITDPHAHRYQHTLGELRARLIARLAPFNED